MNWLILITILMGCSNKILNLKDKPLIAEQQKELSSYVYAVSDEKTSLISASIKGNIKEVERLLSDPKIDVNYTKAGGWTALMVAAQKGNVKVIRALIEAGANVNYSRTDGWTALMYAAKRGCLLSFMKSYAKIKFDLPDDISEKILLNSAFILLLQLLDTDIFINRVTKVCAITQEHINEFISYQLIDLSAKVTVTYNDVTLEMNSIEIIYKHLLINVFDAIHKSNKKEEMINIVNKWSIDTKRKMLIAIFNKSNADKLKAILTNTVAQDRKANEKREALKEMVRPLLVGGVYIPKFRELQILKELIYKIFEDEIHPDNLDKSIIIHLHNQGWK